MSPRRLLFILVFVLWAANGALWAWVQFTPPPPPPPQKVMVMVYCDKKDLHKKVSKALDEAKLTYQVRPNHPWKHKVQEGFLVVNTIPSEGTRKGLYLAMKGLLKVKIVGDDIRLGGAYKTKAEAAKAQKAAKNKGYDFEIKENIVDRTSKVVMVEIGPLEETQTGDVDEALKKFNFKEDQKESRSVEEDAPDATASPSATPN